MHKVTGVAGKHGLRSVCPSLLCWRGHEGRRGFHLSVSQLFCAMVDTKHHPAQIGPPYSRTASMVCLPAAPQQWFQAPDQISSTSTLDDTNARTSARAEFNRGSAGFLAHNWYSSAPQQYPLSLSLPFYPFGPWTQYTSLTSPLRRVHNSNSCSSATVLVTALCFQARGPWKDARHPPNSQ